MTPATQAMFDRARRQVLKQEGIVPPENPPLTDPSTRGRVSP